MKAIIKKSQRREHSKASVIYVKSPLDDVAHEFAMLTGVYGLQFKSKTWSKLSRIISKLTAPALAAVVEQVESIKFSSRAGCSCGCSPGYVVKHAGGVIPQEVWVDLETSQADIDQLTDVINNQLSHELGAEILKHS